jgi:Tol biopolymer transport system component
MGVYTMNADGRGSQLEAEGFLIHNDTLSWSRDGNRIAVAPVRLLKNGFGSDIVVMNANGANGMNLTDDPPARNINPSWSPGGKKIAYVASPDPFRWWPPHNVHVMNADGTNPVMLTKEDSNRQNLTDGRINLNSCVPTSWSPDGRQIAYWGNSDQGYGVYAMGTNGGNEQIVDAGWTRDGRVSWSPDGRSIAYSEMRQLDPPFKRFGSDIFVVNANGSNSVNLTVNPAPMNISASWSPDGKKIAYVASPKPFLWLPPHNIHVMTMGLRMESYLVTGQSKDCVCQTNT